LEKRKKKKLNRWEGKEGYRAGVAESIMRENNPIGVRGG